MAFEEVKARQSAMWGSGPYEPPDSGVADFFAVMRLFQPPPPEGAGNPFDRGRREYVQELLGAAFELAFEDGDAMRRYLLTLGTRR